MALLSDFVPAVAVDVEGVGFPVIEAMIRRAATEFCEGGLCWNGLSDPMKVIKGVNDYELDMPSQARLVMVRELWFGAQKLKPSNTSQISGEVPDWQTAIGTPTHFIMSDLSTPTVRVFPIPSTDGGSMSARMIYAPSRKSVTLPDFLCDRYLYEIADGAKSYLMNMSGKPWTNPQLAAELMRLFRRNIASTRIKSEHGFLYNPSVVKSREFGA